jgi:hypothetical protein
LGVDTGAGVVVRVGWCLWGPGHDGRCTIPRRVGRVHQVSPAECRAAVVLLECGCFGCEVRHRDTGVGSLCRRGIDTRPQTVEDRCTTHPGGWTRLLLLRGLSRGGHCAIEAAGRHDGRQLDDALVACCDRLPVEDVSCREREGLGKPRRDQVSQQAALLATQRGSTGSADVGVWATAFETRPGLWC